MFFPSLFQPSVPSSPGELNDPVPLTQDSHPPTTILVESDVASSAQIAQTFEQFHTDLLSHETTDALNDSCTNNQQFLENFPGLNFDQLDLNLGVPGLDDSSPSQDYPFSPSSETDNTLDIDNLELDPLFDIPWLDFSAGNRF